MVLGSKCGSSVPGGRCWPEPKPDDNGLGEFSFPKIILRNKVKESTAIGRVAMVKEHDSDGRADTNKSSNLTRRRIVRSIGAVGGISFTSGALVSSTGATLTAPSDSDNPEPVSTDELQTLVTATASADDVVNVMGDDWAEEAEERGLSKAPEEYQSDDTGTNYTITVAGDEYLVNAVTHTMESGSELTAVGFATEAQVLYFYEYDEVEDGIETKAKLWEVSGGTNVDDVTLRPRETSINGSLVQSPGTDGDCEGCSPGPGGGGYRGREECVDFNLSCAIASCASCAFVCTSVIKCLACLGIYCPFVIALCCDEKETTCSRCVSTLST